MASTVEEAVEHPLTPEDVAVLLQIDRETVYRMARRGDLPAFKVSSRWRFLPSRLQRWMEEQERQARYPGRGSWQQYLNHPDGSDRPTEPSGDDSRRLEKAP